MNDTVPSSTGHDRVGREWSRAALLGGTLVTAAVVGFNAVTYDPQITTDEAVWDRFANQPRGVNLQSGTTNLRGIPEAVLEREVLARRSVGLKG